MYSFDHCFQNAVTIFWTICHLSKPVTFCVSISMIFIKGSPTRKCPGVRARVSVGSPLFYVNGREFRQASSCVKTVDNSSNVKVLSPITRFRWYFVDRTPASQLPPKFGACGGMKCHVVPSKVSKFFISWGNLDLGLSNISLKSFSAPTKLVPLSLNKSLQCPLREMLL